MSDFQWSDYRQTHHGCFFFLFLFSGHAHLTLVASAYCAMPDCFVFMVDDYLATVAGGSVEQAPISWKTATAWSEV